jgi:sec-independent protein translocase protein TatA
MQIAEVASLDVILIVIAVGLIVFGSSKLPKIARGLGSAKSEFEKGIKEGQASSTVEDKNPTDTPAS